MSSENVFHLGICKDDIHAANIVLMPGDPDRVDAIASHLENPVLLASQREYRTILAEKFGKSGKPYPAVIIISGIVAVFPCSKPDFSGTIPAQFSYCGHIRICRRHLQRSCAVYAAGAPR